MTAIALTPLPGLADIWRSLRTPILLLIAGVAILGLAFAAEGQAAWRVWSESTAYSHCFFVLPISLYLAWERRAEILASPVVPLRWVALAILPLGLAWFVAERLGIMEGRQLMALSIVEVLFLAVLGWRMFRTLSAPLLYLYFLVPFGAFITPILQDWTSVFIGIGLNVLDIPHDMDGYMIEIPEGRFYVAEACAGLRFLIASIAFGVLYACVMYRDLGRRLLFVLASIVIPIIANWFRALGIVVLGHILGSAEAAAADHIIYGWIFFSGVTLVLILAGMPFRQDPPPAAPALIAAAMAPTRTIGWAAGLAVIYGLLFPLAASGLDRAARMPLPAPGFAWTTPLGCQPGRTRPGPEPGREETRFQCPQGSLTASVQIFSPRVTSTAIAAARAGIEDEGGAEDVTTATLDLGGGALPSWRYLLANGKPTGATVAATALWVDGGPARGGLAGRFLQARDSLLGAASSPVLLGVRMHAPRENIGQEEDRQIRLFLTTFLQVQTGMGGELARLAGGR